MTKRGQETRHPGITKTADGYTVRVTHLVGGKQKEVQRKLKGVTLSEAILFRENLRKELTQKTPESDETVAQYAERWLQHLQATGRNRAYTIQRKRETLTVYVLPYFGDRRLHDIRRSDLAGWMEWLSAMRKPDGSLFCKATWDNVWRITKTMFADAVTLSNLEANPTSGVRFTVHGAPARRKDSLTRKELDALLAETRHESPDMACMIWTLAKTGMRFSELSALTWDDVDFVRNVIHVRKSQVEGKVGTTKTGRARVVVLHPTVKELLARHRDAQKQDRIRSAAGLVFPSKVGTYRFVSCLTKPLKACAKRAGIQKNVSTHVFRHSVNNLLRQEAGSVVAMAIIGHSTDAMHGHYSDVTPDEAAKAIMAALG